MQRGLSLIEMLVVVAIFSIISTIILVRNSEFNSTVALNNLAHNIALSIREAQVYGTSIRSQGSTVDSYGVYMDRADLTKYHLFADLDGNNAWSGTNETIETYTIGQGNRISNMCVPYYPSGSNKGRLQCSNFAVGGGSFTGLQKFSVTFRRPNPAALIHWDNVGASQESTAIVQVRSAKGDTRTITIYANGQIAITQP